LLENQPLGGRPTRQAPANVILSKTKHIGLLFFASHSAGLAWSAGIVTPAGSEWQ